MQIASIVKLIALIIITKKNAQIILVTIDFIFIMIKEMRLNLILYKKNMIILQKIH